MSPSFAEPSLLRKMFALCELINQRFEAYLEVSVQDFELVQRLQAFQYLSV